MSFSPILGNPKPQYEDAATGIPSVNYTLTFSEAGTSTPLDTYTDSGGGTTNDNPLTLNSRGEPENAIGGATMIYGNTLTPYKVILKDSAGATVWTMDDVYPGSKVDDWVSATAATRASANTFTVTGVDVTGDFHEDRRVWCEGGANVYGTITDAAFSTDSTITVLVDAGGTLNAGMTTAYVGINSADSTSGALPGFYPEVSGETGVTNLIYPVGNVLRYGADPTYTVDSSAAFNNMYTSLPSINGNLVVGTSGIGTMVTAVVPEGRYKISSQINVRDYSNTIGEDAILQGDAGVTIFDTGAYAVTMTGLIFAEGAIGINIATGNTNTCILTISNCEFHNQTTAGINGDNNSASTITTVKSSKFYFLAAGGKCAALDNVGEVTFRDNWFKSNSQIPFSVGTSIARFESNVFNPGGDNVLAGGRWIDWLGGVGSQLDIRNNRFGGESGGAVVVRASADIEQPPNENPTVLTMKNNSLFVGTYPVEFYKFPNKIVFEDNFGFNATDGFYFDSTLTRTDFVNFAEFGMLSLDNNYPDNISSELHTTNQYLGELMFMCKRYMSGTLRLAPLSRLDQAGIKGTYRIGGGGWSYSGTAPASSSADEYGITSIEIDPTADDQSAISSVATYLDPTALTADKIYTLISIIDAKVLNKEQLLSVFIGGVRNNVFISNAGKTIINTPFVYLNNTGAPVTAYDEIKFQMFRLENGAKIRLSRIILVEGLVEYNNDVVITTGTASPGAFTPGVGFDYGFSRCDTQYRSNVAAASFIGDVCTVQGNPGTWTTFGPTT